MLFGKSKETKEKEERYNKYLLQVFKNIFESDLLMNFDSLIKAYDTIFMFINNNKNNTITESNLYLAKEIEFLLSSFKYENQLFRMPFVNDFYNKRYKELYSSLKISYDRENTNYNFKGIYINNVDALINNECLIQRYHEKVEEGFEDTSKLNEYTISYLMSISAMIGSLFLAVTDYDTFYNEYKNEEEMHNFFNLIKNVSNSAVETKLVNENILNVYEHLYKKRELKLFDIHIFTLINRENGLVQSIQDFLPESINLNNLNKEIEQLEPSENIINKINEIKNIFINQIEPKDYVLIDKYLLEYATYNIIIKMIDKNLLTLNDIINYSVNGFLTANYQKTFSHKKALWDNERYLNNDFSIEMPASNLFDMYNSVCNGIGFEEFCFSLFSQLNYYVENTKTSYDQGADLVLEKDGVKTVVQAKFYSTPVGNKSVQEVVGAKAYYKSAHAIVITNNKFTSSALKLAEANAVTMIDGEKIETLIKDIEKIEILNIN